jgi:hypothetical protein
MFKPLARENNGLVEIEEYRNSPLPEDFEITSLLDDIIMAEYADVSEDGQSVVRNGILLPQGVVDQKAWRVGRVVLAGPNATLPKGQYFIFPGDRGLRSINKNGKQLIFINEQRIFCLCDPIKQKDK